MLAVDTEHPIRHSPGVPLALVDASHIRVVCDACRASAEICGKRDPPVAATVSAVRKFKSVGWHHDVGRSPRQRTVEDAERTGAGRWYCPRCGEKQHL
jgi:hypothetical protein